MYFLNSHPPPDLHGAICSVIFACPRLDIQELRQISQNFEIKYGKEFIAEAMANKYNTVNEKARTAPPLLYDSIIAKSLIILLTYILFFFCCDRFWIV
jgi:hypothetical protein